MACGVLDGRPTAVTAGFDGSLRVWDLAGRTCTAVLHLPSPCAALALTDSGHLVAAFNRDLAVFTRRP
ncbi:hypothetical protein OG455_29965 [Kitasatospora sp. NBC_01287]|nr:hypothetical protein [Kitasatospora sp. NBC_01287]